MAHRTCVAIVNLTYSAEYIENDDCHPYRERLALLLSYVIPHVHMNLSSTVSLLKRKFKHLKEGKDHISHLSANHILMTHARLEGTFLRVVLLSTINANNQFDSMVSHQCSERWPLMTRTWLSKKPKMEWHGIEWASVFKRPGADRPKKKKKKRKEKAQSSMKKARFISKCRSVDNISKP